MAGGKRYISILFDVDGTLIDSNGLHAQAWVDAFAENGYHVELDVVRRLIGMGGKELIPAALGDRHEEDEIKLISESQKRFYSEKHLDEVRVIGDPASLFTQLISRGSSIYLITSSHRELVEYYIGILHLEGLISGYTTADDAYHAKPYPDLICNLLQDKGLDKERSLMVGDSPYDVIPAIEVGIPIIAVLSGGYGRDELQGAVEVYADLNEFESNLHSSMAWK